jgi:RND family efflux transporter MFP subunit
MAHTPNLPAATFAVIVRKIVVAVGFTVVVVVLLLALAGKFARKIAPERMGTAAAPGRPLKGETLVPVAVRRIPTIESAVGTIRAVHETAVGSKLLAKVVAVHVQAGQEVKNGDVLVRLDDRDLVAQVRQAEARVNAARAARDLAQTEFDRIKPLYERGVEAKSAYDQAEAALKTTQAELEQAEQALEHARASLEYATIRSPIDGKVIDKRVEVGDTVTPGQTVVTLFDPTRMQLVASVRESLTHRLSTGQMIGVHIDALNLTCEGRVSEIVPEAESASRTFAVKVTGPCPSGVYSGMFGRLLIPLDEEEVLTVPQRAVRKVGQLDIVDVAQSDSSGQKWLVRRVVQLGRPLGDDVQVLSGLRAGEEVALPSEAPATEHPR